MSTELKDSYLAAIVDGEGHIGIQYRPNKRHVSNIIIEMTHPDPITMFQQEFGGPIYQKVIPSGKTSYRYVVEPSKQEGFLNRLLPHMKVKSPQAQCVLQLINLKKQYPVKGQFHKLPTVINAEKQLFNIVKALNA
jgi:hypothetical protein